MKKFFVSLVAIVALVSVTACGTVGGAIDGAGDDLKKAGKWVKSVSQ